MKKLILLFCISPILAFSQDDCESHAAVGLSYVLPRGISVEGAYFANRLTAGIGVAYQFPANNTNKAAEEGNNTGSTDVELYAYAGVKLVQIDYLFSAFVNTGYIMGNSEGARPFVSSRFLFPSGRKAFSVEPFYIFNRGFSGRAAVYLKF